MKNSGFVFLFVIIVFKYSQGFSQHQILDDFLNEEISSVMAKWNSEGYWPRAKENMDNRYNEAILLSFVKWKHANWNTTFYRNLKKTIYYSIDYLQNEEGFFVQNNKSSHMRTSLFLKCLIKPLEEHPDLLKDEKILLGISRACKALEKPHPFAYNQNIAAMSAFYSLYKVFGKKYYFEKYTFYRDLLLKEFIELDKEFGYWPEAPEDWKNRLNVPYLFVQSMMLQDYLISCEDMEMHDRHIKLNKLIYQNVNIGEVELNVENSIGNFASKGIKTVPVSVASFFWMQPINETLDKSQKQEILRKCIENFRANVNKDNVVLYTDLYYRFAMINEILSCQ
jgi:hypothetical protein